MHLIFKFHLFQQHPEDKISEADETDAAKTAELPAVETDLVEQEFEQTAVIRQEEFGEVEGQNEKDVELKDKKVIEFSRVGALKFTSLCAIALSIILLGPD